MKTSNLLSALSAALLPIASAEEQVLGVYLFHRHGDRTAKAWAPVNLTTLGDDQVHASGNFFRSRYVARDATHPITGISTDIAALDQLDFTAPVDNVLHSTALVFTQGLYPPTEAAAELLANGTTVQGPFNGYQYIPVNAVDDAASGTGAESSAWLQGSSGCDKAAASSNDYLQSKDYNDTLSASADFYKRLTPVIKSTYAPEDISFKNAYAIFDLINVATIHNTSIPSDNLLNNATISELYDLASTHEWNLAFNSSDQVRAIAGSVLAGQVVDALEAIVEGTPDAAKFNAQFGAYGAFMSFFGLAQLPAVSNDFFGICDYASVMAFELVTNATKPTADDVSVRFYFANGTAAANPLGQFPLFGQKDMTLPWADFKDGMEKFAIKDNEHWCTTCGNTDGTCAAASTNGGSSGSGDDTCPSSSDNGISRPVAGVIGAMVTLAVILLIEGAVMLFGGLRLAKKSTLAAAAGAGGAGSAVKTG